MLLLLLLLPSLLVTHRVGRSSTIRCRPSSVSRRRLSFVHHSLSVIRPLLLSVIRPSSLSVVCRPSSFVICPSLFVVRPSSVIVSCGCGVCTLNATQLGSGKPRGRRGNVVSTGLRTCAPHGP